MIEHLDTLKNTAFYQKVFQELQPVLVNLLNSPELVDDIWSHPLTTPGGYVFSVNNALIEVSDAYERLQFTLAFIANFRSTPATKRLSISRHDYMIYHIENFYIRLVTVFDRTLILVDRVLSLGNDPRHTNWSVIGKNEHVKVSSVHLALKAFDKFIGRYRYPRNLIVHERGHQPEEDVFYYLSSLHQVARIDETLISKHVIRHVADRAVIEKLSQLEEPTAELRSHLGAVFEALLPEFQKRL